MEPQALAARIRAITDTDLVSWWRSARLAGAVTELRIADDGWDAGAHAVDVAVDEGASVLLLVDPTAPSATARAITAIYCGSDATAVMPDSLDDLQWMRSCAEIRDAMPALRPLVTDVPALLAHDPRLAACASAIAHAAARSTPVVISGTLPQIAALCAQRIATSAAHWVQWGFASHDAAAVAARTRLAKEPWFETALPLDHEHRVAMLRTAIAALDAQIWE